MTYRLGIYNIWVKFDSPSIGLKQHVTPKWSSTLIGQVDVLVINVNQAILSSI